MSHHTAFHRGADAAYNRRTPCDECGGRYSERLRRVWHEASCTRWRARPFARPQTQAEQDAERAELAERYVDGDACPHGIEPASACPGCAADADRAWEARTDLPEEVRP